MGFLAIYQYQGARGQNYGRTKHLISAYVQENLWGGFLGTITISRTFYY